MNTLSLSIPARVPSGSPQPAPDQLEAWLSALNMVNAERSATEVVDALGTYNSGLLTASDRMQALALFIPVVTQLVETLRGSYRGSSFPLSKKNRPRADLVGRLLEEMANGYKLVVVDVAGNITDEESAQELMLNSVFLAMYYLGEMLLAAYLIYMPEPEGVWGQLSRLYSFAEQQHMVGESPDVGEMEFPENVSAGLLFKRMVMLNLANPYHLMEGDAVSIYRNLLSWGIFCSLNPIKPGESVEGKFYMDLADEEGPRFASSYATHQPTDGRRLELGRVAEGIGNLINDFSEKAEEGTLTLKERMNRDMLVRLQRVWGGRMERQFDRAPDQAAVLLAAGLTASHHFISGEQKFQPEHDEAERLKTGGGVDTSGLSLMPIGQESWKQEEEMERIDHGVVEHRVSRFDPEASHKDAWDKVHVHKTLTNVEQGSGLPSFQTQQWHVVDTSEHGMGLVCDDPTGIRIRVGDLVAFRDPGDQQSDWQAAVVRWFNTNAEQRLEVGLMTVSGQIQAIGVRGVKGTGEGSEYFRALLVKEEGKADALIIPAMIFDLGSELLINKGSVVEHAQLVWLVDTTTSFSRFGIDYLQPE